MRIYSGNLLASRPGKLHRDPGAGAGVTVDQHRPIEPIGQSAHDGQAHAMSTAHGRVGTLKRLEQRFHLARLHAYAAVLDDHFTVANPHFNAPGIGVEKSVPYQVADQHREHFLGCYGVEPAIGQVCYIDGLVGGQLLRALEETGLRENTVVVVTSDHGDMIGERGMWFKKTLFEQAVRVPLISAVIGEGGSGGAIAIATGDHVSMLEHSIYSVISPEGCASILWRSAEYNQAAAEALRLTADDLLKLGLIDDAPEYRENPILRGLKRLELSLG